MKIREGAALKDIAAEVGVSIRTVGRALRGAGYVEAGVRERVLAAAARLGYQPNLAARALKTGTSQQVVAIIGSMDELHVAKLQAFEAQARAAGFSVLTMFSAASEAAGEALLADVVRHAPAGVAVFPGVVHPANPQTLKQLGATGIPVVFIDPAHDFPGDAVWIDRPSGVHDAVQYLARSGCRRIAYLGNPDATRLDGYSKAMRELGHEPLIVAQYSERHGELTAFFDHVPRPDAVQVYSDVLAMRLLAALHARGLRVPEDVAVIGFDNRDFASLADPPLTTVAQPNREVGEAAADILLRRIRGEAAPAGGWSRRIPTTLVVRQSTQNPKENP